VMSFGVFIAEGHDVFDAPSTPPETPALLHFTSGTTGEPQRSRHVHGAVVAHVATARTVLDLHPDDVYWCTADAGWVTGTLSGMIVPLATGATTVVDEADFDAQRCGHILTTQYVEVFCTTPAALRMLQRVGAKAASDDFAHLRLVASVGEPFDADSVVWARKAFRVPVLDT